MPHTYTVTNMYLISVLPEVVAIATMTTPAWGSLQDAPSLWIALQHAPCPWVTLQNHGPYPLTTPAWVTLRNRVTGHWELYVWVTLQNVPSLWMSDVESGHVC